MKKLFLIPLMALACSVMAWGTVRQAGSYAELQSALTAAQNGDEIQLTADIPYSTNGSGLINITKSITINGKDDNGTIHTISGYGARGSNNTTIAINNSGANFVSVVLKDLIIRNAGAAGRPIETRGNIESLTLNNVKLYATGSGNCQGITIGGNQASAMTLNMTNSLIDVTQRNQAGDITKSGSYAIISFNPYNATIDHCTFYAWAGLYFKAPSSSQGSRGSVVNVENTAFHCSNYNSGSTNSFGGFVCEDDGITITATNCTMESSALGDQAQAVLLASGDYIPKTRRTQPISLTLAGDNTRIIMDGAYYGNIDVKAVKTFDNNTWYKGGITWGSDDYIVPFSVTITGGTYDVNPYYYRHVTAVNRDEYGQPIVTEDGYSVVAQSPIIPAGRAVTEIKEGNKTLYRVTNGSVSYDINGNYEESGEGDNPTTSFIVEAASADETVELVNNATEAAYVQVRDNTNGESVTLAVGKEVEGEKVNQTLVVNNGLDVQGNSQVTVQPGSTLQIGEGGIVTEKPENIVIEADETGAASFLLDPAISVNSQPNLTVKMLTKVGKDDAGYAWHRFAMPVTSMTGWTKEINGVEATVGTYLYGWDYDNNDWLKLPNGVSDMVPYAGYTLTHNEANGTEVTYVFKGNLVGNQPTDLTLHEGYNFFGNSYTAYIDMLTLLTDLQAKDANIQGTAWMWNNGDGQGYSPVTLRKLKTGRGLDGEWQKEVSPMQTFILQLKNESTATGAIDYSSAIWGNPRYGKKGGSAPAPARMEIEEENYVQIVVTDEKGNKDAVDFTENASFSDAYENGIDANKFMNAGHINFYSTIDGEDYTSVATDKIEGKMISLKTVAGTEYTLSFKYVEGTVYAIKDMQNGKVTEMTNGNTYKFTAQENATTENRFMIVTRNEIPSALDNVEAAAVRKGVYTLMGQYLGESEMFSTLPAGVYVVDGVKVVK